MTDTTKQKPSRETLAKVLTTLATVSPIYADAMRAVQMAPDTIWLWAKQSREGVPKFKLRWPDPEGDEIWFHEAMTTARQMQLADFEARLRRDVSVGHPRTLRTPAGDVVWEIDAGLIAAWEGNTDDARTLGGIVDPFYRHDERGARIPVVVYDPSPAALRQHVARAALSGYNPSDRKEIDSRHSGGVMILKAGKQGDAVVPPAYARNAPAATLTPLQTDLMRRLEDLRERGPVNPRPTAPVQVMGRPSPDDPVEQTVEREPEHRGAAEHARVYRAGHGRTPTR